MEDALKTLQAAASGFLLRRSPSILQRLIEAVLKRFRVQGTLLKGFNIRVSGCNEFWNRLSGLRVRRRGLGDAEGHVGSFTLGVSFPKGPSSPYLWFLVPIKAPKS